jgi:hypothetical protein
MATVTTGYTVEVGTADELLERAKVNASVNEADIWTFADAIQARLAAQYPAQTFVSRVTKHEQTDTELTHP